MTNQRDALPCGEHGAFALDVHFAEGQTDAALERHVQTCAQCKAYLVRLEAIAREAPPAWSNVRMAARKPSSNWLRNGAIASALAIAAALFFVLRTASREPREGEYVGAKGTPAVQALVRGASGSRIWDGRAPIHPGDAIALRAGCEGFAHVAVAAPSGESWSRVYDGACTASEEPLPFTLVVDAQPGEERVTVIFSGKRLDDAELASSAKRAPRTREAWAIALVFPKVGARP